MRPPDVIIGGSNDTVRFPYIGLDGALADAGITLVTSCCAKCQCRERRPSSGLGPSCGVGVDALHAVCNTLMVHL
jgi:hypothetical protein